MAAGVTQPGGPGTTIFVYDDSHANAGGDGSYSFADIKAAMDVLNPGQADIEYLQGAISGLPYSGTRRQYMLGVSIQLGGGAADGTNPTTLKDTSVDIFQRVGAILYRIGGGPIATRFGTKLGSVISWPGSPTVVGRDGVTYTNGGAQTFRNDLYIYGSKIQTGGTMIFSQVGASTQEVSGNLLITGGINNIFGDTEVTGNYYNNTIILTTGSNAINGMRQLDGRHNTIAVVTPPQIISVPNTQTIGRFQDLLLSGSPTTADFRSSQVDYSNVYYIDVVHTDNAPRWNFSQNVLGGDPSNGVKQMARFNTKVVDKDGNSLINIPIRLFSSVLTDDGNGGALNGVVLDAQTFGDGDVGFTHGPTGYRNGVVVREHYNSAGIYTVRDRTFTLYVNMPGGTYPIDTNYPSQVLKFEWPGRDQFRAVYQANGGGFLPCIMPITLGAVTTGLGVPTPWHEYEQGSWPP